MHGLILKQCGKLALGSLLLSAALTASAVIKEVVYVESTGAQWINTHYVPTCTDTFEMKVRFSALGFNQGLWCARGSDTAKNTMTCFAWQSDNKLRLDRNTNTGTYSPNNSIGTTADHVIVANYSTLKATIDGGSETTMASGDFTCGGVLTLLASHQAYGSFGNFSKMKLYSFKITDKDGNVVREFVPAKDTDKNEFGLFETQQGIFYPGCGTAALAGGEEVAGGETFEETFAGCNVISVAAKETKTWAQATSGMSFDMTKPTVKVGGGTVVVADEIKNYAGEIRIRDGFWRLTTKGAMGTGAGKTYVEDGGTLENYVETYVNNGSDCGFEKETVILQGEGCGGEGALKMSKSSVDWCRTVFLEGDTLINATGHRLDLRFTVFTMNGFHLDTIGDVRYVAMTVHSPGDVTCKPTYFEFQSSCTLDSSFSTTTYTFNKGTTLGFWDSSTWWGCGITMQDGTAFSGGAGTFKHAGTDNRNILSGPITLEGKTKNSLSKNMQMQFRGKLTGDGCIWGGNGGYLQFLNDKCDNDFKGGLDISGVVENGNPVGGVLVYQDYNIPSGDTAAPLKLTNASLQMRDKTTFHLPDVVASNRVVISNMATVTSVSAKSLKKTGVGELTVFGPLSVSGKTEIDAGTLKLATKVPSCVAGLKWSYRNNNAGVNPAKDQGVDLTGVGYAYKAWPSGVDMAYSYTGYIRVPGEEGQDVTCNWMTSIARGCKVTIGGVVCCEFNDNKNVKDNITVGYARLAMYKPVTLKAGWQPITVTMNNWWDTTRGPQANATLGWADNFGIGVDWQNRSVTNTTYYAKLLDPGDGSFLRATLDDNERSKYLTESKYRATFAGDVAFGPGAVFDIGDAEPYWPVTVPSLTGLPTVRNGELKVTSSTWTLRASDLTGAVPLTVGANAKVTFPSNVTITGDASALAYKKSVKAKSLIAVEPGGTFSATTFTLSDDLKAAGYALTLVNGKPVLSRERGLALIIK